MVEANLLEQVLRATEENLNQHPKLDTVVANTQRVYTRKPKETFITEPQKRYITGLRDEARKVGLYSLAAKTVRNRSEASDYIGELKRTIAAEKAKPKPKPCGCGMRK